MVVRTRASDPTEASAVPSTVTVIDCPLGVPVTCGSEAAESPPGDVGLPPPQPSRALAKAVPSAAMAAAEHVRAQNCRRVCGSAFIEISRLLGSFGLCGAS